MSRKLDAALRERLENRRGDWPEIAVSAGISHSWLSKFANGHIPNPGLRTLERLELALAGKRVAVEVQQPEAA